MAKRRILKKYIAYIAGDLFAGVLVCKILLTNVGRDKTDRLLEDICVLQEEFIRRAHKPDGKDNKALVREYYRKLLADFETKTTAIAQEIESLHKEQTT
jgi:DNA/RNA-binding domain of Phe-tRNA-synthetase-like protein